MKNPLQKSRFSNLESITAKLFLTFAVLITAQQLFAQFIDSFADGEFTSVPPWTGLTSKFVVDSSQLRLKADAETNFAYLSTPSRSINDASWEFLVRLNFNPSSTNYTRIYLTSDQPDLAGSLNGYFVLVGGIADNVSLCVQTKTSVSRIIDGTEGVLDLLNALVRIKVSRDSKGMWKLYTDVGNINAYRLEGSTTNTQHLSSSFFGVYCAFTATRSDQFYFDEFSVTGNAYEKPEPINHKDIIITEILADPLPSIGLPEIEFVEILNRSDSTIDLNDIKLTDGLSVMAFSDLLLASGDYLILTTDSSSFKYGKVFASAHFPSLSNSGDLLMLVGPNGELIDSLVYTDSWYRSAEKKEGGWSLELIDPENICGQDQNWIASDDASGGTPGKQNSVFAYKPDLHGPVLRSAIPISPTTLQLTFDETLQKDVPSTENFAINPPVGVRAVSFPDESLKQISIELSDKLSSGVEYTVTVNSLFDCAGNPIDLSSHASFGLPEPPALNDIAINEIIFNPWPSGADFVEIVNTSSKFFNLKDWRIGNIEDDTIRNFRVITPNNFLLKPGAYVALTEDAAKVKGDYPLASSENILQIDDMPSLNDDSGSVAIAGAIGSVLDQFQYSESMHSVFIKDPEGVSLERIDFSVPAGDRQNWKSCSTTTYATPGYLNSNSKVQQIDFADPVTIEPEVFIPVYGQPDFTLIHYKFDQGGYVANIKVVDSMGRVIKQIVNDELLGVEGMFRWDGDKEDGSKARTGSYMVWFEIFSTSGEVRTFTKRVAVATTF